MGEYRCADVILDRELNRRKRGRSFLFNRAQILSFVGFLRLRVVDVQIFVLVAPDGMDDDPARLAIDDGFLAAGLLSIFLEFIHLAIPPLRKRSGRRAEAPIG